MLPGFWLMLLFGINTILAVSLNITNGWSNLFSIGHGGIMLVGRYAAVFLTLLVAFKRDILDLTLPTFILNNQVPFLPALLIAIGQDQDMAEHMGVNLLRYKVYTFKIPSGQGDL